MGVTVSRGSGHRPRELDKGIVAVTGLWADERV
jgi:hypothetical protein